MAFLLDVFKSNEVFEYDMSKEERWTYRIYLGYSFLIYVT